MRSITSDLKTDIVISLPYSLVEITAKHCKSVQSVITQSCYKDSVSFSTPQKLFVNPEVFRNLFKPTIDALIKHLNKLFKDPNLSDLHHIIMVGGFSECKHCKSVQSVITQSCYKDSVSFSTPQKLFVNPEVFRNLFKPTIDALIKHLNKLFKDPNLSDLHHIIMVGGFSECELVQTAMRNKYPNRKIIIPDEAGLVVLRGVVFFGHQPKKIGKRILRKTYGIQSWPEWDAELHPDTEKVRIDGIDRCKDVFYKFAVKGGKG
ncbi:unnamed protein product [Mytilus coruscus]|uniref:Uncharacterized protein n=1 Tax=Mytilus coruscus TaxID=42192 RepID=A0A6J7ZUV4_MYTCO|nr:unnamed protein product [Mytilus coruscus]